MHKAKHFLEATASLNTAVAVLGQVGRAYSETLGVGIVSGLIL